MKVINTKTPRLLFLYNIVRIFNIILFKFQSEEIVKEKQYTSFSRGKQTQRTQYKQKGQLKYHSIPSWTMNKLKQAQPTHLSNFTATFVGPQISLRWPFLIPKAPLYRNV